MIRRGLLFLYSDVELDALDYYFLLECNFFFGI